MKSDVMTGTRCRFYQKFGKSPGRLVEGLKLELPVTTLLKK